MSRTAVLERPARSAAADAGSVRSDQEIWRALVERVHGSNLADQLDTIAFDVRDGQVTLTGELDRWRDIPRLINLTWEQPGVAGVDEFLHWHGESETEAALIRRSQLRHRPAAT